MIDKRVDEIEEKGLKKINNHHFDKRKDLMKKIEISDHEILGDVLRREGITSEQITLLNSFLAKMLWI